MITQEYTGCGNIICEYKNCKKEVEHIQMTEDTEEAYYKGKLRCENHKTK